MAKYSYEFKKKVVEAYLQGRASYTSLAKKYSIPSKNVIIEWVAQYREHGDQALIRSREKKNYSFEYKMHVVELYLTSEVSYLQLASQEGISSPSLITTWVNAYRREGLDALKPLKKGRPCTLGKKEIDTKAKPTETTSVDVSAEKLKQLESENLKLRIENAFLKELRRLRLEEEALLKKQRESYTASEENSD